MIRVFRGSEGNISESHLSRQITEIEVTCDICGKTMYSEDDVFNFGRGHSCLSCLIEEFKVGTVDDLVEREV